MTGSLRLTAATALVVCLLAALLALNHASPAHAVTLTVNSTGDGSDFTGGADTVRYSVDVSGREGPFVMDVELWYQPISHRWAQNLRGYKAAEPQRFVRYFDEMASSSALRLARATSAPVP